jgi:hypothetical protein
MWMMGHPYHIFLMNLPKKKKKKGERERKKNVNSSAVPYSVFHEGNGFEC